MFNAILIIVSHVVDPEYVDDRSALHHLDQAVHMIRQMSVNHLCAQRAYHFLQQLLKLLDQTMPDDRQRPMDRSTSAGAAAETTMRQEQSAGQVGASSEAAEDMMQTEGLDLWSFWDSTQDLTMDLGSQLELHSSLGSAMWSWGPQGSNEPPSVSSTSLMGSVMHPD